jgi:hypothetical protein
MGIGPGGSPECDLTSAKPGHSGAAVGRIADYVHHIWFLDRSRQPVVDSPPPVVFLASQLRQELRGKLVTVAGRA